MSSVDLQELAHVVVLSGNEEEEMDIIASCGAYGTSSNHIHRDLLRKFCTPLVSPPTFTIQVPAIDPKGGEGAIMVETNIMLPSSWIATLAATKKKLFTTPGP